MYTYIYTYVYIYLDIYIYTHTHTHARTFSTASDLTVLPSASSCTLKKKGKNSIVSSTICFQIISDLTFENKSNWLFQT